MAEDDDDEWRFAVEDVGPDADEEDDSGVEDGRGEDAAEETWGVTIGEDDDAPTVAIGDADAADASEDGDGNVAGAVAPEMPVEAGDPDLESAVFVGIGALVTILVFVSLIEDDPAILGGVALSVVVAVAALYAFFTRV